MCPPVAQHCGHRARLYLHLLARRARRSWATWCPARCCTTMWARASRRGARLPPSAVPGLGGSLLGLGGGVPGRLAARRAAPLHSAPQAGKASAFRGLCMPTSGLCMPMCWIGGPAHGAWEGRSAYPACHAAGLNTQALEPGGTASTARAGGLRADAHRAAGTALRRQAARPAGAHRQACRAAGRVRVGPPGGGPAVGARRPPGHRPVRRPPNLRALLFYGFVLRDNPHDTLALTFEARTASTGE